MEFIIKLVCNFLTGCMAVDFTAGLIGFIIIIICTRADAIASDSWIYLIPDQLSGTFSNTCKKVTGDYYSQNTFRDVTMTG